MISMKNEKLGRKRKEEKSNPGMYLRLSPKSYRNLLRLIEVV
jgi:hypothetical protein